MFFDFMSLVDTLSVLNECVNDLLSFTFVRATVSEGVASHALRASTHWHMVVHITYGTWTTSARTRINAFVPYTGFIWWTFVIQCTFRPTTNEGITMIFWYTCAYTIFAVGIWSTWIWWARIVLYWSGSCGIRISISQTVCWVWVWW